MHTFIVRPKDYDPSTYKLDKTKLTIGRSSRNDICIGDPFASRLHADQTGKRSVVVDNGSATDYLNGSP